MLRAPLPSLSRIFRPRRQRIAGALATVGDAELPRDVWTRIVELGLAAAGHEGRSSRWFLPRRGSTLRYRGKGSERLECLHETWAWAAADTVVAHPLSVDDCLLFASDPEGISKAEKLAEEAAQRLTPWEKDFSTPEWKWVWQSASSEETWHEHQLTIIRALSMLNRAAFEQRGWPLPNVPEEWLLVEHPPGAFGVARDIVLGAVLWRELASRDASVPLDWSVNIWGVAGKPAWTSRGNAVPVGGRRYTELPDPFEPLLELLAVGYVPSDMSPGVVILRAPSEANA
jgi:hypothetical protein